VTVNIASAPTITITPPSTPPSVGIPAQFTIAVAVAQTGGSAIRNVRVNWGDGNTDSLGAVTGNAVVSHVYQAAGTYAVTVTATDASGNSSDVGTFVSVIPVPRPTIVITPTPRSATVNDTINFSIQVTVPAGIGIQNTTISFGDGTSQSLGGAATANVPHDYATAGTKLVTVTVLDTTGQTTEGTTTVSITP
jgi:PKD repeat protein